jgi:Fic family protein
MKLPPAVTDIIPQQWALVLEAYEKLLPGDCYQHWDELKKQPQPEGIGHAAWWAALKLARSSRLHFITFRDRRNQPFNFNIPDGLVELLHQLDHGRNERDIGPEDLNRFIASALFEEAIASARLAGATVHYAVAKEMLRTGRPPGERSEQMIVNLQLALEQVRGLRDRELSPEIVLELHRCITEGTLDEPGAAGRFRRNGEKSLLVDPAGAGQHEPPPAGELPLRMEQLCAFANGRTPEFFIHPVIRAVILHFWLAYDRPFLGGNGRTARTLFRWAMLRQAYPLFELLSISPVLLQAPADYARAFLQTETDDNDLTYFILHQATVIRAAVGALHGRAGRKTDEVRKAKEKLRGFAELNPRQQALIAHALRKPDTRYVVAGHQRSQGVTHQTARDDLFDLSRRELLEVGKEGRRYIFQVPADLTRKLQSTAGSRRTKPPAQGDELPTTLL